MNKSIFFLIMLMQNNFAQCSSGNTSIHKKPPAWTSLPFYYTCADNLDKIEMPGAKKKTLLYCLGRVAGYSKHEIIKRGCKFKEKNEKYGWHTFDVVVVQDKSQDKETWKFGRICDNDECEKGNYRIFLGLCPQYVIQVHENEIAVINYTNQFGFDSK